MTDSTHISIIPSTIPFSHSTSHHFPSQVVGWLYIRAQDPRERYKEHKFILERSKVLGLDSRAPVSPLTSASLSSSSDVEDPFEMV